MKPIDITVAITAHSETVVCGPTLRSAEEAIRVVEEAGFRVERLIGLDAPSEGTRAFFSQPELRTWNIVCHDKHDLGLSRNALVDLAAGRWIAFLDADDLFGHNWLLLAANKLSRSEKTGQRTIVHPELNWVFDGDRYLLMKPSEYDILFTPYYYYFANYFDAICMAPREAYREVPFAASDASRGFGYEDWQWNIEVASAGWRHVVAKDTIIFKRRRDDSLVTRLAQNRTVIRDLDEMAIDRVVHPKAD